MERFVLIDAIPGMVEQVAASLPKYPAVRRHRLVRDRNVDILALVEGTDPDDIADYVAGTLRFVDGVHSVRFIEEAEDMSPTLRKAFLEIRG